MNTFSPLIAELHRQSPDQTQALADLSGDHTELQAGPRNVEVSSPVALKLDADVRKLAQRVQDLQNLITELTMRSRQLGAGPLSAWTAPGLTGSSNWSTPNPRGTAAAPPL